MARVVSPGYLLPQEGCIESGEWLIESPDHPTLTVTQGAIPLWHYDVSLLVVHGVHVKLDELRTGCRLDSNDELRVVLTWQSSSTRLQGSSDPTLVEDGGNVLDLHIPGEESGGELTLRTEISVRPSMTRDADPLLPRRPGSLLWSDSHRLLLEGDAYRFPTEAVNFETVGLARPKSAWLVEVDTTDLDAPALDRIRLILNTEHDVYSRLQEPDTPGAALTRQFLAYDVARQLVAAALECDELTDDDYERASVGHVLRQRLQNYFGDVDLLRLHRLWRQNPRLVEAQLQARFPL